MKTFISKQNALKLAVLLTVTATLAVFAISGGARVDPLESSVINEADIPLADDPVKARAAFNEAVKVFFSARCANCHPAGDIPTQGDEMVPHTMAVTRGKDGHGVYGQKCSACH